MNDQKTDDQKPSALQVRIQRAADLIADNLTVNQATPSSAVASWISPIADGTLRPLIIVRAIKLLRERGHIIEEGSKSSPAGSQVTYTLRVKGSAMNDQPTVITTIPATDYPAGQDDLAQRDWADDLAEQHFPGCEIAASESSGHIDMHHINVDGRLVGSIEVDPSTGDVQVFAEAGTSLPDLAERAYPRSDEPRKAPGRPQGPTGHLAKRWDVDPRTVRRWLDGDQPMPRLALDDLRILAAIRSPRDREALEAECEQAELLGQDIRVYRDDVEGVAWIIAVGAPVAVGIIRDGAVRSPRLLIDDTLRPALNGTL